MDRVYEVIKRPLMTEKSTSIGEKQNSYLFEVDISSTKEDIKEAVEKLFDVKVRDVNTMINHGKIKRVGRHQGVGQVQESDNYPGRGTKDTDVRGCVKQGRN
jgi:large subunit ribosomal protein L23